MIMYTLYILHKDFSEKFSCCVKIMLDFVLIVLSYIFYLIVNKDATLFTYYIEFKLQLYVIYQDVYSLRYDVDLLHDHMVVHS